MPDIVFNISFANLERHKELVPFGGEDRMLDASKSMVDGRLLDLDSAGRPDLDYTWTFHDENDVAISVTIVSGPKSLVPTIRIPEISAPAMTKFIAVTLTVTLDGQAYKSPPFKFLAFRPL